MMIVSMTKICAFLLCELEYNIQGVLRRTRVCFPFFFFFFKTFSLSFYLSLFFSPLRVVCSAFLAFMTNIALFWVYVKLHSFGNR